MVRDRSLRRRRWYSRSCPRQPLRPRAIGRGYVLRLLVLTWLLGLAVSLSFVARKWVICHRHIRRTSSAQAHLSPSRLTGVAGRLGVRRRVHLLVTDSPFGPAAFGLLRPTVLLPGPLLRDLGPDQLELILAHELVHIRRWDALLSRLQLAVQVLWWFHPLVWWANREASRERERCCDEEVVAGLGCDPARYARSLLEVLERKRRLRPLFALPGMRPLEITTHRLEHIMRYRTSHGRYARLLSWLAFAAGAVLLIPGAGLQSEPSKTESAKAEWGKAVREWKSFEAQSQPGRRGIRGPGRWITSGCSARSWTVSHAETSEEEPQGRGARRGGTGGAPARGGPPELGGADAQEGLRLDRSAHRRTSERGVGQDPPGGTSA